MTTFLKRIRGVFSPHKYYVFGDSHTQVFNYLNKVLGESRFCVNRIDGATALGMANPNSKTNALPEFLKVISLLSKKKKLIFLLGEVDLGFLIWHRHEKMNTDVNEELNKSINNYLTFLTQLSQSGYKKIFVLSPTPPSVIDEYVKHQQVDLRRNIKAGIVERTKIAIQYNNILRNKLYNTKVQYVDLYDVLIDNITGIVKSNYLNSDRTDHHLDNDNYGQLIINKIKKM